MLKFDGCLGAPEFDKRRIDTPIVTANLKNNIDIFEMLKLEWLCDLALPGLGLYLEEMKSAYPPGHCIIVHSNQSGINLSVHQWMKA